MLETACKQNVAKCGGYDIGKLGRFWSNKELKKKGTDFASPDLNMLSKLWLSFLAVFIRIFRKNKSSMKAETIVSNQSSTKWIMFIHLGLSWMELDDSCLLLHRAVSQSVGRSAYQIAQKRECCLDMLFCCRKGFCHLLSSFFFFFSATVAKKFGWRHSRKERKEAEVTRLSCRCFLIFWFFFLLEELTLLFNQDIMLRLCCESLQLPPRRCGRTAYNNIARIHVFECI